MGLFKHLKIENSYHQVSQQWNTYRILEANNANALELARKAVGVCQLPLGLAFVRLLRAVADDKGFCIALFNIFEPCALYENADLFEYLTPEFKAKLEAAQRELNLPRQVTVADLAGTPIAKKLTREEVIKMGLPTH